MKRSLCLILSLMLLLSSTVLAAAETGITLWAEPTKDKVVPQSTDLAEYGTHVGRPQPVTTSSQPVVDKALVDFVPAYAPDELTGKRVMKCSDVLAYICHDYVDAFNQYYPNVEIDLSEPYVGSAGAAELINGTVDFVIVSREPRPNEYPDFEAAFGYPMSVVPVQGGSYNYFGWLDAMCFVVNKDNPIESITMQQIDSIFSSTYLHGGEPAEVWGDLGLTGEWAEQPIVRYAITHWNGFEEFIRIRCLDKQDGDPTSNLFATQGSFRDDMIFNSKVFDQAKLVSEDPYGIAYTGLAYVDEDVKVLPIRLEDGTLVAPTYENVCNASWPLSRLCYINYNKAPDGEWDPILKEFLRFLLSKQAAEIVAEQNIYVPLTAKQANDARDIAGLEHEDYILTVAGNRVETENVPILYDYVGLRSAMYLPLFDTLDAIGATYTYDEEEVEYHIECGENTAVVRAGSGFILVNDQEYELSLNSKVWNECLYMPSDGMDLICGTKTDVDTQNKTVTVTM